ncbi:MAG TPA: c-type cytochrome [Anaerolineales bacterium]|nr:c-type cytochrome [Anaerolineales bacterium]
MFTKLLFRTSTIALGIALLTAGLFFDGGTASPLDQQATPVSTLDPFQRLAEPTLPAQPSQADHGAQDYWLYCLPCHGERGQGLTDEFRETYPPDEVNCWQSGCHGKRPYEFGFSLPTQIPAVVEHSALAKFTDAAQLNAYIRATMPFWNPGSLTEDEAWRVTAFILRENDLWDDSTELNASNAVNVKILRGSFLTPIVTPPQAEAPDGNGIPVWIGLVVVGVILISLLLLILKKSRNTTTI